MGRKAMKRATEVFSDAAAFRKAVAGKGTKRTGASSVTVTGQGDRLAALTRIAAYGFMPRWRAGAGFDFWSASDPRTTTAHAEYPDAVQAAEQELSHVNND